MKLRILLGALMLILFTSVAADAQRGYHRGYHGRGYYGRGYYRPRAVVVVPPRPVVVAPGYYGPRYRRGYYGPRYRRGYYAGPRYYRGYHRGYYAGPHRGYYHHRRW